MAKYNDNHASAVYISMYVCIYVAMYVSMIIHQSMCTCRPICVPLVRT